MRRASPKASKPAKPAPIEKPKRPHLRRDFTPDELQEIRPLWEAGYPPATIAPLYRCSPGSITRIATALGWSRAVLAQPPVEDPSRIDAPAPAPQSPAPALQDQRLSTDGAETQARRAVEAGRRALEAKHGRTLRELRRMVDEAMQDREAIAVARERGALGRYLADLSAAAQRLVELERRVSGLDTSQPTVAAVIVVPAKLAPADWDRAAAEGAVNLQLPRPPDHNP